MKLSQGSDPSSFHFGFGIEKKKKKSSWEIKNWQLPSPSAFQASRNARHGLSPCVIPPNLTTALQGAYILRLDRVMSVVQLLSSRVGIWTESCLTSAGLCVLGHEENHSEKNFICYLLERKVFPGCFHLRFFWGRVSCCSPDSWITHSSVSTSQVLGLQECSTTPRQKYFPIKLIAVGI